MSVNGSALIVSVSFWDTICIHMNAVICGLWTLIKDCFKWFWNPNAFGNHEMRGNPPMCLVDSALGQHSYAKLKGIKLHYVESGPKDKPLVLLLHGFPDCWLSWRNQIPELNKHFRVVALDLKGFGDSDKPQWRNLYRIELIVMEIEQFISCLGASSCMLVGHDLGALIGWFLVHKSPLLVRKFVSISCPHPNIYWDHLNDSFTFNNKWVHMSQLPYLPEIDALKEDLQIINKTYAHLNQKKSKSEKDPYVEAYKYTFSRKEDWTGPINYFRNLPFSRIHKEATYIPVNTLLIMGNKDPAVKIEGFVKSTDYCQKYSVKIVDDTGHFPHQQKWHATNELILDFLVEKVPNRTVERKPSLGLANRMVGAVSSTVKYGNTVIDGAVNSALKTLFLANN